MLGIPLIPNILGKFWWLIPNYFRLRLPISATGFGFIKPLKPIKWELDPRELISQKYFSYGFGKYEKFTQKALFQEMDDLRKNQVIHFLNVGANTGLYALLVGKRFPMAKISLFEPIPTNLIFLRKNMKQNNLAPDVFEFAAGAFSGIAEMYTDSEFLGLASFKSNKTNPVKVKIARIDDVIQDKVDVVLIDVEGHEIEVLRGMDKTLKNSGPTIILETSAELLDAASKLLKTYGYSSPTWLGKKVLFGPSEKNFLFKKSVKV
jgi:FkbM family methyltransferase